MCSHGNGFLINIGGNSSRISRLEKSFLKTEKLKNVSFYNSIDVDKNTKIIDGYSTLKLYLGDRHYSNPAGFVKYEGDSSKQTGIVISMPKSGGNVEIHSDFLGSELVYYTETKDGVWITDRIDNFSRFGIATTPNYPAIYSYLSGAFTVGSSTLLDSVYQLRPLEHISINTTSPSIKKATDKLWITEEHQNVPHILDEIDERMHTVLNEAPRSNLMLSAGWDSRVLLSSNPKRISHCYTHGDINSREVSIAFKLGAMKGLPMSFAPLTTTSYSADNLKAIVSQLGQVIFPHWYQAGAHSQQLNNDPLTAGLGVEIFSGHYGINSLSSGKDKLVKLVNSMLTPQRFDRLSKDESLSLLTPLLSAGFNNSPWFASQDMNVSQAIVQHKTNVADVLEDFVKNGTTGAQEICERFKLEHQSRQFYALQTKSASCHNGYYHPYIDSQLNQQLLKLKYRDRVNYKVSKYVVAKRDPSLLTQPLAATLVNASKPVVMQEASRVARVLGEQVAKLKNKQVAKGLGWNNFQFLLSHNYFHDYVDMLSNSDYWDKNKMHTFIENYKVSGNDAYALFEMLTKIITVDYKLNPKHYSHTKALEKVDETMA